MINSLSGNTFTWNVGMTDLAPYENGTKIQVFLHKKLRHLDYLVLQKLEVMVH